MNSLRACIYAPDGAPALLIEGGADQIHAQIENWPGATWRLIDDTVNEVADAPPYTALPRPDALPADRP